GGGLGRVASEPPGAGRMTEVAARQLTRVAVRRLPRPGLDLGLGAVGLACGGVAVWSAAGVDPTDLGDGGLSPALTPAFWAAVVALNLAFVLSLGRRAAPWLSPVLVAGLVLLLYGPAGVLG